MRPETTITTLTPAEVQCVVSNPFILTGMATKLERTVASHMQKALVHAKPAKKTIKQTLAQQNANRRMLRARSVLNYLKREPRGSIYGLMEFAKVSQATARKRFMECVKDGTVNVVSVSHRLGGKVNVYTIAGEAT